MLLMNIMSAMVRKGGGERSVKQRGKEGDGKVEKQVVGMVDMVIWSVCMCV